MERVLGCVFQYGISFDIMLKYSSILTMKLLPNMYFILFPQCKQKGAALVLQVFSFFVKNKIDTSVKPAFKGGFFRINAGRYDART